MQISKDTVFYQKSLPFLHYYATVWNLYGINLALLRLLFGVITPFGSRYYAF
jgi:hypothetical protein